MVAVQVELSYSPFLGVQLSNSSTNILQSLAHVVAKQHWKLLYDYPTACITICCAYNCPTINTVNTDTGKDTMEVIVTNEEEVKPTTKLLVGIKSRLENVSLNLSVFAEHRHQTPMTK